GGWGWGGGPGCGPAPAPSCPVGFFCCAGSRASASCPAWSTRSWTRCAACTRRKASRCFSWSRTCPPRWTWPIAAMSCRRGASSSRGGARSCAAATSCARPTSGCEPGASARTRRRPARAERPRGRVARCLTQQIGRRIHSALVSAGGGPGLNCEPGSRTHGVTLPQCVETGNGVTVYTPGAVTGRQALGAVAASLARSCPVAGPERHDLGADPLADGDSVRLCGAVGDAAQRVRVRLGECVPLCSVYADPRRMRRCRSGGLCGGAGRDHHLHLVRRVAAVACVDCVDRVEDSRV